MTTAFYSIIQFCPNAARQEAVNVGVILFDTKTGYVGVKFTPTLDRIRKFFGHGVMDAEQLKALGESVHLLLEREQESLRSPEEFMGLAGKQANEVRFTPPRKIAIGHPQNVLEAVYQRLVEKPRGRVDGNGVDRKLRRELRRPEVARFIEKQVVVPVPRSPMPIRAPFGYQNGVFNLIQSATFQADDGPELYKRTGCLHLEGKLLRETTDSRFGRLGLVVVGEVKGKRRREAEEFITDELRQESVKFYSVVRLSELVAEIMATGTPTSRASTPGLFDVDVDAI